MKKTMSFVLAGLAFLCFAAGPARADYALQAAEKLGRGLSNIVLSPVEFTRDAESKLEQDQPARLLFVTPFQGTIKMVRRIAVGVYEVATFMVPEDPILEPSYLAPGIEEYLKEDLDPRMDRPAVDDKTIYPKETTQIYENQTK